MVVVHEPWYMISFPENWMFSGIIMIEKYQGGLYTCNSTESLSAQVRPLVIGFEAKYKEDPFTTAGPSKRGV